MNHKFVNESFTDVKLTQTQKQMWVAYSLKFLLFFLLLWIFSYSMSWAWGNNDRILGELSILLQIFA